MRFLSMGLDGLLGVFMALAGGIRGIVSGPSFTTDDRGGGGTGGGPGLTPDG